VSATRLIAIDLDGTLIGEDLKISDADRAAIERATAAGVEVCIATGRLFSAARPFAEELGLSGFLIPLNGAAVFEILTGEMVRAVPLDVGIAREALDALRLKGFRVQLYFGDRLYLDGVDARTEEYLRLARVEPVIVPDLRELLVGRAPPEPGPMKVLGIGAAADVLAQVSELGARLGSSANVFRSLPQYLEVTDPRANKGLALAWIAAQRGLDAAQVAAIGDSDNDAPMLSWAARSYAVAGATQLAKAAAKRAVGATGSGVAMALADLQTEAAYERA
jgi:Cof subfamily protein (haloacid dehalogenase superfamily)